MIKVEIMFKDGRLLEKSFDAPLEEVEMFVRNAPHMLHELAGFECRLFKHGADIDYITLPLQEKA